MCCDFDHRPSIWDCAFPLACVALIDYDAQTSGPPPEEKHTLQ